MIKSEDILVGDWIECEGEHFQSTEYTPLIISRGEKIFNPIMLTPQIMQKCAGFNKYEWFDGFFKKTNFGDLMVRFYEGSVYVFFTNIHADKYGMKSTGRSYIGNINSTQNIKYLHQLQHLLLLIGQQLEYTP